MKNLGPTQSDLQALFRGNELQNRATRRAGLQRELLSLRKRMANEGMLLEEQLTEDDKRADAAAKERMIAQQLAFEKETTPGYWRRLWTALLNR